jgi:hypothetical protein
VDKETKPLTALILPIFPRLRAEKNVKKFGETAYFHIPLLPQEKGPIRSFPFCLLIYLGIFAFTVNAADVVDISKGPGSEKTRPQGFCCAGGP